MSGKDKQFLSALPKTLESIFEYFIMLLMGAILTVIPLQVFCRFVLHSSLQWPDEFSPYVLAWITFLGAVVAMKKQEHISFNVLVNKLPDRIRFYIIVLKEFIVIFFLTILFFFSIPIVKMKWNDLAYTISISKGAIYLCVPLGSFLMLILTVSKLIRYVHNYFNKI